MIESYINLTLSKVPSVMVDELTYDLFELGAQGVSEKLKFTQTNKHYAPDVIPVKETAIESFFLIEDKEKLEALIFKSPYKELKPKLNIEKNKDWLKEWKKHYKPFCVIDNLWVYPSWEKDKIKKEQEVILVDPGLAFGTGTHATTELCLKALSKILKPGLHNMKTALDMGAGTGILATLIKKRGVKNVLACEVDEMAREKCRENLEINECSEIAVLGPEELGKDSYDIVVANIIDGVLLKIKKELVKRTNHTLLLSGILLENEENVLQEFLKEGLKLKNKSFKDEWSCLEFVKST